MSKFPLVLLRISVGYLLIIWGLDKLVNPAHGLAVSSHFYFGLFNAPVLMSVFGVAQLVLGALVVGALWRRYTYPAVVAITAMTLIGVWRSILDPWGWYLSGSNALFYPSLIIFAAALVLLAEDGPTRFKTRRTA